MLETLTLRLIASLVGAYIILKVILEGVLK
jgi:hypothetical protein